MNTSQNEPRIILKNEKGQFLKHIKLGKNFLFQIDEMSVDLNNLLNQSNELNQAICLLNWKINSLLANKILFYYQGIEFTRDDIKQSPNSISNFISVIENINSTLCSLIYDFSSNRESGDPKVIHDHIIFLVTIYKKLYSIKSFKSLLSVKQQEMVETQFQKCFSMFNNLIDNAILNNRWSGIFDFICILFDMGELNYSSNYNTAYLQNCRFDFENLSENIKKTQTVKRIN